MLIINQILQESQTTKKFIGIRTYGSSDEMWCGYVLNFNDKIAQVQHFTEYGAPDGILIVALENIEGIDSNYNYADAIEYLFKLNHKSDSLEKGIELPNSDLWQSEILLKFEGKKDAIGLIHDDENTYYGRIEKIDKEFVKLKTLGTIGESEGFYTMRIQDIKSIRINNAEAIKRNSLSERKGVKN